MKIVSLAPSNTEIIYSLGLEEDLEAVTSLCDHPKAARDIESVGGWTKGIDFEKIRDEDPDLILASDSLQDKAVEELEDEEVLQVKPETWQGVLESIISIGSALSAETKAEKVVDEMERKLSGIELEDSKRIYCEEWMEPPMVSGNWIPGLVERINGEYFIEEGERSRKFDLEELKDFDPEYIFLNVCGAGEKADKEALMNREGWQEITAVKQGNVFVIDDALLNRPGPRLVEGARKMKEIIEEN